MSFADLLSTPLLDSSIVVCKMQSKPVSVMEDGDPIPMKASEFYARRMYWLPEDEDISEESMCPSLPFSNSIGRKAGGGIFQDALTVAESCPHDAESQEIVEIAADTSNAGKCTKTQSSEGDGVVNEIYVAVGEEDLKLVKWVLDHHAVDTTSSTVVLVHVYPPVTYVPTPVGKFPRDRLNPERVAIYMAEEKNRRKCLMQKYVDLCTDAKIKVETVFLEKDDTAQAIVDLISDLEITKLIIGTNKLPTTWGLTKKMPKGAYVKRKAPDYCQVKVVYQGKMVVDKQRYLETVCPSTVTRSKLKRRSSFSEKNLFLCLWKN